MTTEPFMSDRQVILEIRDDVKELRKKIDQIDREGSIGTKAELIDHESRLRSMERWKYAFPPTFMTAVAATILALLNR